MIKWFSLGFWELIARIVLRNRILMLSIIAAITVFLALQWKNATAPKLVNGQLVVTIDDTKLAGAIQATP